MADTLCIFHVADFDGKGSAAIVKSIYPDCELLGHNHTYKIPEKKIKSYYGKRIIICDISLPMDLMNEINKNAELIWNDHHVSSISIYEEYLKDGKIKEIKGNRNTENAAIKLNWQYFYPDKPIPRAIELFALYDVYQLINDDIMPFEYAMRAHGSCMPDDEIWTSIINGTFDVDAKISEGRAIKKFVDFDNIKTLRSIAFESEFNGYKCLCANQGFRSSQLFESVFEENKYDFFCSFYMLDDNTWKLGFYTNKDNVDCSKIASMFGGGGHRKASGTPSVKKLPEFLTNPKGK